MSSGGALTQLISTGAQDAFLQTNVTSTLTSKECESDSTNCTSTKEIEDNTCPIENYMFLINK